jgi:hypothetical protein
MKSQRLKRQVKTGNLSTDWFHGLTGEAEKEELRSYLSACTRVFTLIKDILQRKYDHTSSSKETDYDSASWSYKQAHRNGYLQALEDINKLMP